MFILRGSQVIKYKHALFRILELRAAGRLSEGISHHVLILEQCGFYV